MFAQISSPIRALILLFALISSLYIFHPYTPSRSSFSFTNWRPHNTTATEIPQGSPPAKAPHNAIPPPVAEKPAESATPPIAKKPAESAVPPIAKKPTESLPEVAENPKSGDLVDDPDEGGPRVRQATMIYESGKFNSIYERSIDTHIKHGEKWGVPTHILRHDIIEAGFFNKPAYVLGLIIEEMAKPYGKRAGWIVWFDADTIILNPSVPWTLFLPPSEFDEIHLLATQDFNGFNAGMAIFRVHEWSVQMLSETIALRQLLPDVKFEHFDQGALRWVFEREGYAEHLIYQPHHWWNSFGLNRKPYDTDAFTLHFAGVDCCGQEESRGTVMGRWLDIVESKPETYVVELEKTKLPKEVEEYWALLSKAKKTMKDAHMKKGSSRELQAAKQDLWAYYTLRADNATEVSLAIKKVEDIMAQVGVDPEKPKEPSLNPAEQAIKDAEIKKNAEDRAKQIEQKKKEVEAAKKDNAAKKEEESKKEDEPAEKDAASEKKGEKQGKKEEASAKKEAVEAKKKAAQAEAEAEAAATKKGPAPPAKRASRPRP